jgi:hypothetical protein
MHGIRSLILTCGSIAPALRRGMSQCHANAISTRYGGKAMQQDELQGTLTIFFIDGSKMRFAAPPQKKDSWDAVRRLQSIIDRPYLAFETADGVVVIPTSNIKYVQASPKPEVLPDYFFRDATLVEG